MDDVTFYGGNAAFTIIGLVLGLALLGANVFVAIDAGRRPDWAFKQAGTNKGLWIGLGVGGAVLGLCCGLCGLIALAPPIVWFASFRNKVIAAEQGGPYQGYGGPPPGYGPPPGGFPPPPPGGGFPPPPGGGFPPPPAPPTFGQ